MPENDGDVEGLKRFADSYRKRGHAPYWHADNEFQGPLEVGAVIDWAKEMNKRGWQIYICMIKKNCEPYPDCIAEMNGEKIGVEVTELVDEDAIKGHPENPHHVGPEQFMSEFQWGLYTKVPNPEVRRLRHTILELRPAQRPTLTLRRLEPPPPRC